MSANVFKKLDELSIPYTTYQHEPLFTAEQAVKVASAIPIPGAWVKNLFLKDSKGNLYLVVAVYDTAIALKKLSKYLHAPELRFASPELLRETLGVEPGSVTLFALINDVQRKVTVILDSNLFKHEQAGFHPLVNTATTVIATKDISKFIELVGNKNLMVDFGDFD